MREISDDQLLIAAALADPFAPASDDMNKQTPRGILRNSAALWEDTAFEDHTARPEAYPLTQDERSPVSSRSRR